MVHTSLPALPPLVEAFDEIVGSSVQLRVLGLLVTLPDKEFTGREIASLIGASHSNVQRSLRILSDRGFVEVRRIGRADVVRVNRDHFAYPALRELFRLRRDLPGRVAGELRSVLEDVAESVVVFGSYARGEAGRASDLDLLVVPRGRATLETESAALQEAFARRYDLHLSIHVVPRGEFRRGPWPAYVRDAVEEGILLAGTPLEKVVGPAR